MRYNIFGEPIFQPEDSDREMAAEVTDREGMQPDFNTAEADLYTEKDEVYGYGGNLYFEGIEEPYQFDGFDTVEELESWLADLGVRKHNLNEIA